MFRHRGKNRTFEHNLRLATLLSFVAGVVNISGVLGLKTLTTNVTGHFAYFAEEIMRQDYTAAITFLFFTICFLAGAFISSFLTELVVQRKKDLSYKIPTALEMVILTGIGLFGSQTDISTLEGKLIAFLLLFAMGI